MREILFKIRINVQQEKEIDRLKKRINDLIVLRKKNNGLTAREDIELRTLKKDYNSLTGAIVKQNQVQKTQVNTLGRVNAELAIERQRIKDVVIGSKQFDVVAARIKNLENKQRAANAAMGRGTTFVGEYARGAIQAFQKIAGAVMAVVIVLRTLSRVFKGIINTLEEFEQGQMNVQTLLESFDSQLKNESIILMRKYGLAITDLNRALFDAISAGVAARDSFGFMNDAAILAIAGVSDMESVVDGMTTVMNVWNIETKEMDRVAAAFFSAQKKGKFYISDITKEIGKSASMAKIAGMSYQELMTTYAELTKKGLPLQESTTAIKAIIKGVTAPSIAAAAAFKKLDIQTGLTAVSEQGLFTILTKINQATKVNKDVLVKLLPNVRAITGAAALNEEALQDWHKILKVVIEDFGEGSSMMRAYELQMGTLTQQKKKLKAAYQAFILTSKTINLLGKSYGKTIVGLTKILNRAAASASDQLRQEKDDVNMLIGVITDEITTKKDRLTLLNKLQNQYPGFLGNLNTEKVTNEELADQLKEVNKQYDKRIAIGIKEELISEKKSELAKLFSKQYEKQLKLEETQAYQKAAIERGASQGIIDSYQTAIERIKGKVKGFQDERKEIYANVEAIMKLVEAENAASEDEVEGEETRKERFEAQQRDEQQAFDDELTRLSTLFEANKAFDAADKEAYDAALEEFYFTQEEKQIFIDEIADKNLESLERHSTAQLKIQQKTWDEEEKEEKKAIARIKDRAKLVTEFASDIGIAIESALLAEENQFKEFAKGLILASLAMLKSIADIAIAEATIRSIARYGLVRGSIRAGAIAVGIEIAYGAARALILKMNKGGEVYGQGNKDTVPALLTPKEGIINARSMTSRDVMTVTGTPYDIASQINAYKGFGVPFAAGGVAGTVTNNTYNYNTMERLQSDIGDIKVILNMNEVSEGLNEINVIQQTGEI